jgi:hypothetical protein
MRRWVYLSLLIVATALGVLLPAGSLEAKCANYPNCGAEPPDKTVSPAVTNVSPRAGSSSGGTKVTITVQGFDPDSTTPVEFGGKPATSVKLVGVQQLQVTSPAHSAGGIDVRVDAPYQDANTPGGWTPTTASDRFTYCNGSCVPPTITSISPASGPASGNTVVTIQGTNLDQGETLVRFGSQTATPCSFSSTQLVVVAPPAVRNQPGPVDVTVTTINGASRPVTFTYTPDMVTGSQLNDNRNRFTATQLLGLSFLPSFITNNLPGITGRVITQPAVHALFWDRSWDQDNPGFHQSDVDSGLRNLVNSGYLQDASQYGVGQATSTGSDTASLLCLNTTGSGNVSMVTLMLWITCEAGGNPLADTEAPGTGGIEGIPQADGLPLADDNIDYAIFMPAGASIGLGSIRSCGDFGAFHFFTVVSELRFGWAWFVPYPEIDYQTVPFIVTPVECASGGVNNLIDNVSHELVESATDPLVGLGWIENSQFSFSDPTQIFKKGEASDICENAPDGSTVTINGFSVERYWSNRDNGCVPTTFGQCPATPRSLTHHPSPALLGIKVRPLNAGALGVLRHAGTYVAHGTLQAAPGPRQPRINSEYTIEQQGPNRALYEGRTKVDGGPWVSFEVIQVGSRRCVRGAHGWVCRNKMPHLNTQGILAELMNRQFSTPTHTSVSRGLTLIRTTQGNVRFTSMLNRSPQGMPMRLAETSRVDGKMKATENLVFDYTPQPAIKLPK